FYWFAQLFLLIVFIVMISGAGATFTEHFGMGDITGRAIMAGLVLISVLLKLDTIVKILGVAGPTIIIFAIIVGFGNFNSDDFLSADELISGLDMTMATEYWWQSGFVYSSF